MKILITFDDRVRADSTAVYFREALKSMGHQVQHVYAENLHQVKPGDADIFLKVDDGLAGHAFPANLHPSAYYVIDTHLDTDWRLALEKAAEFDFIFCAQKKGLSLPWQSKRVEWLPLAADIDQHHVGPREKKYDVAFIGNFHSNYAGKRIDAVDAVFKRFPNFFFGSRYFRDMAEVYAQSRIVFNQSLNQDINMRFFEAMASGSCLVTDFIPEADELGLYRGLHYAAYDGEKDMLETIDGLLKDSTMREKMAKNGMEAVHGYHTYKRRCSEILNKMGELCLSR